MTEQTQPEALRLIEWIESDMCCDGDAAIVAELRRQHAEIQRLKEQLCMQEVYSLATYIFRMHYSHEPHYASGEVVWGLCGSTRGVISQIDNMVAGLTRKMENND